MKLYNNLIVIMFILSISACSNNIRRAEPIDIVLPTAASRQLVHITPEIKSEYDIAINYIKDKRLKKARHLLESMANKYPGIPGVHLNLALLYYHAGEFDASREQLDKTMDISSANPLAYNLSGALYRNEGSFKQARRAYATAIKLSPDYADAHLNIAILFDIYFQYWESAKQHYLTYLKLSSTNRQQVKSWLQDVELRLSRGD